MSPRLAILFLATALAGCGGADEAPMTIDGVSPEQNETLEPDAALDAPTGLAPAEQVAPTATLEPSITLQPDTMLTPR